MAVLLSFSQFFNKLEYGCSSLVKYSQAVLGACCLSLIFVISGIENLNASAADVCDIVSKSASEAEGVPASILLAITRAETGRTFSGNLTPWPWTVNMEGIGKWFKTRGEAREYVDQQFESGARSFDLGCFQVNYRWHGTQFSSIDEMLDPLINAQYAAKFLNKLYKETEDWDSAVAAYHSRNSVHADKYLARFTRIRNDLDIFRSQQMEPPQPPLAVVKNSFPLLQNAGGATQFGSLVPLTDNAQPAFLAFADRRQH